MEKGGFRYNWGISIKNLTGQAQVMVQIPAQQLEAGDGLRLVLNSRLRKNYLLSLGVSSWTMIKTCSRR